MKLKISDVVSKFIENKNVSAKLAVKFFLTFKDTH